MSGHDWRAAVGEAHVLSRTMAQSFLSQLYGSLVAAGRWHMQGIAMWQGDGVLSSKRSLEVPTSCLGCWW